MTDTIDPVPQHRLADAEAPPAEQALFEKTEDLAEPSANRPFQKSPIFNFDGPTGYCSVPSALCRRGPGCRVIDCGA
jgi:hypothetical protein